MAGKVQYDYREYGFTVRDVRDISSRAICLDVGNSFVEGVIDHHHISPSSPESATCTCTMRMLAVLLLPGEGPRLWPGAAATRSRIERLKEEQQDATFLLHNNPDLDSLLSAFVLEQYLLGGDSFQRVAERILGDADLMALVEGADRGDYRHPGFKEAANLYFVLEAIKLDESQTGEIGWTRVRNEFFRFLDGFLNQEKALPDFAKNRTDLKRAHERAEARLERDCTTCLGLYPMFAEHSDRFRIEPRTLLWVEMNRELSPVFNIFKEAHRHAGGPIWLVHYPPEMNPKGKRQRLVISTDGREEWALLGWGWHLQRLEGAFRNALDEHKHELCGKYPPIRRDQPRTGYFSNDPWYDGRGHQFTIVDSPNVGTILGELGRAEVVAHLKTSCPEYSAGFEDSAFSKKSDILPAPPVIPAVLFLLDHTHPRWPLSFVDAIVDLISRQIRDERRMKAEQESYGTASYAREARIISAIQAFIRNHEEARKRLRESLSSLSSQSVELKKALADAGHDSGAR